MDQWQCPLHLRQNDIRRSPILEEQVSCTTPCIGVMRRGGQARPHMGDANVYSGVLSLSLEGGARRLHGPALLELVPMALVLVAY